MKRQISHGLAVLILALCARFAQAQTWPIVPVPEGSRVSTLGQSMRVNGMPMRITDFETDKSVDQTTQWFKAKLGSPLMDNTSGQKRILGRAQDGYYITIQLHDADPSAYGTSRTQGLISVSNLVQTLREKEDTQRQKQRLEKNFPEGTRLLSVTQSDDEDKTALHMMATNNRSLLENVKYLSRTLASQGYQLETSSASTKANPMPQAETAREALFFRAPGKEASVLIAYDKQGQTAIVLNIQSQPEKKP